MSTKYRYADALVEVNGSQSRMSMTTLKLGLNDLYFKLLHKHIQLIFPDVSTSYLVTHCTNFNEAIFSEK